MELGVTVQLDGRDVFAGTLFTHARRGVETASFTYDSAYLALPKAFAISPDLPLVAGALHSQGKPMFSAFADAMPDRWGRNLLRRAEVRRAKDEGRAARTLLEVDYLTGVNDAARQGALRFWADGQVLSRSARAVPREVDIPTLLGESDKLDADVAADIHDLFDAGSSLGGARPKASVVDEHGTLMIAKFPKADETAVEDVCAWECVALDLAGQCGIDVPSHKLLRVGGRAVLLLERFDRRGDRRVPYLSGLSAIQGEDGGTYSYLELVEFLEQAGSQPEADITQLWRRVLFSCLVGNTDDHMRNHGFLWDGKGWRLSPVFDVNPTSGASEKYLRNTIDLDDARASSEVALAASEYYRVSPDAARETLAQMRAVIAHWRAAARARGIASVSIERMASNFE